MNSYDVAIIGGGISGAVAAIASARCGANTLIVEQYGYLGGMLTAGGVGPMMTFHAGEKQVIKGITDEIIRRLVAKGKSPGHIFDTTGYTYTVTPFDAEALKHELEIMLLESGGKILYHTMLAGVKTQDGSIISVALCNKAGLSEISAKVFIDATGDADLSCWAGVPCQLGREKDNACQPMTMNLKMINVNIAEVRRYIKTNSDNFKRLKGNTDIIDKADRLSIGGFEKTMQEAKEAGEITPLMRSDLLFFETNTPGEVIVNTTRIINKDGTNPWMLTEAEIEGRRQVRELEAFLKHRVPGFEAAQVEYSGPAVGVRSSRQIIGEYRLTIEDLVSCKRFNDVIAHGGYPVDIHPPEGKHTKEFSEWYKSIGGHISKGKVYSIPYRSLVNRQVNNLITVGRCISATFEAQGAIRVTPIAGAIGHAGGIGAYLASKGNLPTREINIKTLQSILVEQGAYLELI